MSTPARYFIEVLIALGAGGLATLLTIGVQKRKMLAETGKTDAEADTVLADAYSRRAATQVTLLGPYERVMARQQEEIDEQAGEIRQLRAYIELLTSALRAQGVEVPPMPSRVPTPVSDQARRRKT